MVWDLVLYWDKVTGLDARMLKIFAVYVEFEVAQNTYVLKFLIVALIHPFS